MNKVLNIEPIALPSAVANLLNGNISSLGGPVGFAATQPYLLITHMRIINTTAGAITVKMYKGATGVGVAGTEFGWENFSLGAGAYDDWYGNARFDSADFLTGFGSATGVTLNIDAEIAFS